METVVLVIHLIIAACLIAAVLLQRSEGGALGIGGGGGGGISSRGQTTPLAKLTWGLATAFICTSITLAIMAGGREPSRSVLDELGGEGGSGVVLPDLPPAAEEEAPAVPPSADDGVTLPDLGDQGSGSGSGSGASGEGGGTAPVAPPTAD